MRFAIGLLLCALVAQATKPQHGGLVFASGPLDVEFVLKAGGGYQLYFMDPAGEELPATTANGLALTITHAAGAPEKIALKVDDSGDSWVGTGASTPITGAKIAWNFRGQPQTTDVPFNTIFHAELQTKNARAGEPVPLGFLVKDFFNKPVRVLQIEHEKPMHLMVVSRDLSEFWHIHPQVTPAGVWQVPHTFKNGGDYRLFADYTPVNAADHIEGFDLKVQGPPRPAVPLVATRNETVLDGMKMVMSTNKPLRAGDDITFNMDITDAATGKPIHNLQPYLASWSHIAVISEDTQDFLHVHPMEVPGEPSATTWKTGGPSPSFIRTISGFRRPGMYKMWVQVQRNGKVSDMAFVYKVAPAGSNISQAVPHAPAGSVLVNVSSSGFAPASIPATAGKPLKLAFFRADAANCASSVVFPSMNFRKDLPPGQTTVVDVTPTKSGPLSFECGMKMFHGQLVVR